MQFYIAHSEQVHANWAESLNHTLGKGGVLILISVFVIILAKVLLAVLGKDYFSEKVPRYHAHTKQNKEKTDE